MKDDSEPPKQSEINKLKNLVNVLKGELEELKIEVQELKTKNRYY